MHDRNSLTRIDPYGLLIAAIPVLVVLALLVPVVDVDPTAGVTFSNSPFTDEAWYTMNARNWALFGTLVTDKWVMWVLTVPFTVVDAVVFKLLGVGIVIAAARQPNVPSQCQIISRRHYLAAPTDRPQSTHITQTNPTKILLYYHDLTIPLDMMAQKMTRESEYPPLQRLHYDHYKASAEAQ